MVEEAEKIEHYTYREGGDWKEWPIASYHPALVPEEGILETARKMRDNNQSIINGLWLHSFRTSKNRRWDCISGWSSFTVERPDAD
jgi:hypothetical protein